MFRSMCWLNESEVDAIAVGAGQILDFEATEKWCRTKCWATLNYMILFTFSRDLGNNNITSLAKNSFEAVPDLEEL